MIMHGIRMLRQTYSSVAQPYLFDFITKFYLQRREQINEMLNMHVTNTENYSFIICQETKFRVQNLSTYIQKQNSKKRKIRLCMTQNLQRPIR